MTKPLFAVFAAAMFMFLAGCAGISTQEPGGTSGEEVEIPDNPAPACSVDEVLSRVPNFRCVIDIDDGSQNPVYDLRVCEAGEYLTVMSDSEIFTHTIRNKKDSTFTMLDDSDMTGIMIASANTDDELPSCIYEFLCPWGKNPDISVWRNNGSLSYLGRNVTEYFIAEGVAEITYYIDDAFGICVKMRKTLGDKTTGWDVREFEPDSVTDSDISVPDGYKISDMR